MTPLNVTVPVDLLLRIERHLTIFGDHMDGPMGPLPSENEARNILADLRVDILTPQGVPYGETE